MEIMLGMSIYEIIILLGMIVTAAVAHGILKNKVLNIEIDNLELKTNCMSCKKDFRLDMLLQRLLILKNRKLTIDTLKDLIFKVDSKLNTYLLRVYRLIADMKDCLKLLTATIQNLSGKVEIFMEQSRRKND